jgi:geranylgeranyl reductase
MKNYDVIIVGAGPSGLRCAEVLAPTGLSVLVLEKQMEIGTKICAGGITRKIFRIYDLPDTLIEQKINKATAYSEGQTFTIHEEKPFAFTIDRKAFGQWQAARLKNTEVAIETSTQVTDIKDNTIEVNHSETYGFRYLVGADGASSLVRRHLNIPVQKRIITFQYLIPGKVENHMEIFMNSGYFHSGYAWVFPHNEYLAVGCCVDPRKISPDRLKDNFHQWLNQKGFDISNAQYQSFPLSYDYHGLRFNNLFLVGEAAGLTSGLTGEGIYPALVSGQIAAQSIIYDIPVTVSMKKLLHYKRVQETYLNLLYAAGPFKDYIFNLTLWALNNISFRQYVTRGFS